jgi:mannose-6-phosphate isomerase-like protein (cupin superfamily)
MTTNKPKEYFTEERCHILELHNTAADPQVSLARARVEPGVTTKWHAVTDTVERYVIVQGTGIAEVGEQPAITLQAGDHLIIPAGIRQRIQNTGTADLIFHCICTPRFQWHNYQSLEP